MRHPQWIPSVPVIDTSCRCFEEMPALGLQAATKAQLEFCALGISTITSGPSNFEDRLHDATTLAELQISAADIYACSGDGPIYG